jgi:hypothetical protein
MKKPQGMSGPIAIGSQGIEWKVTPFPDGKAEREELIAMLFVNAFDGWVATQSDPSLAPFGQAIQNQEADIDFTVSTALGEMAMELAEFAPLQSHGPRFEDAPTQLRSKAKAELAVDLIRMKSDHQGGASRFLVVYVTEQGFWLDPGTIERMRRMLADDPPKFDRVYYISLHGLQDAPVSEIFPGVPHHTFGHMDLDALNVYAPHPTEMIAHTSVTGTMGASVGGQRVSGNVEIDYDLGPLPTPRAKK